MIYYDEVSVWNEKSSLPSWVPEARSEMLAKPCRLWPSDDDGDDDDDGVRGKRDDQGHFAK